MDAEKHRRVDEVVRAVQRKWGAKALQKATLTDPATPSQLSSGHPDLDRLTGGLSPGAITELVGAATAGLHTLTFRAMAPLLSAGDGVVYLDLPGAFDPDHAAQCGVDVSRLLVIRPQGPPEAWEIALELVHRRAVGMLVWDSLPVLLATPGGTDLLARGLRRLTPALPASGCAFLVLTPLLLGRYPLGANALTHHAALRLHLQRRAWRYECGQITGYEVEATVLRNRHGPEGKGATLSL
jgi:hypothetical protein